MVTSNMPRPVTNSSATSRTNSLGVISSSFVALYTNEIPRPIGRTHNSDVAVVEMFIG